MEDPDTDPCSACLSRRAALRGVARAGAGAVSLSLSMRSLASATLAGATLAGLPAGCMQAANSAPMGPVAAGNVADVPIGTLNLVVGENVILGRDAVGLYAMSRVCTHQGQLVSVVSVSGVPALHCYAHGSEFSMNGSVTHGPAGRALEHFKVELGADGSITIQGGQLVAPDWRMPVA